MANPKLTKHQLRLLQLIAEGKTDREIGEETFYAHRTIKHQVRALNAALSARNRTHAVARAFRLGLMPKEAGRG